MAHIFGGLGAAGCPAPLVSPGIGLPANASSFTSLCRTPYHPEFESLLMLSQEMQVTA
jgi:hypothetical protein